MKLVFISESATVCKDASIIRFLSVRNDTKDQPNENKIHVSFYYEQWAR